MIEEELISVYTNNEWKALPKKEALKAKIYNLQKRIRTLQSRISKLFDEYEQADNNKELF